MPGADSVSSITNFRPTNDSLIPVGYGHFGKNAITAAVSTIGVEDFNQGLISDPRLLIQGRIAGLQVYNRGGDPNLPGLIRIRGLSGFSNRNPLIVVDGLPGASLQNLDPNDVASITVLKDGAAQAIYGIRASNGVLLIQTKDGSHAKKTFTVAYSGQTGLSTAYAGIPVMSAEEFRAAGGTDLGASTDWLDEVKRDGFSGMHHLAIQGKSGRNNYRLSGNYRDIQGVLRQSGFNQLNVRANLNSDFFEEKLSLQWSASYTDRSSRLGFQEAFRYAAAANPTAPVFAEDAPFPSNPEQFGGYFELLGLFDYFNPRAIVDLNDRNGRDQVFTSSALLEYRIRPGLSLNARYAYQDIFSNERAYYSPQSLFRGSFFPLEQNDASADLNDRQHDFSWYEVFANYQKTIGQSSWALTIGSSYQDGHQLENSLLLRGFSNEQLLAVKKIEDYSDWASEAVFTDTLNNGWSDRLSAFFARGHLNIENKLIVNASLRYEGSSKLGENNQWGLFPAIGMALNLHEWKAIPAVDLLKVRMSYGITGNLPYQGGLSRDKIVLIEQPDGSTITNFLRNANPELRWEEKSEFNLGLDFKVGKLQGFVDWYTRKVKDWIRSDFSTTGNSFSNKDGLKTSGIELGLGIDLLNGPTSGYTTGIVLSAYQSRYDGLISDPGFAVAVGGLSQNPSLPVREGGGWGDILAPVFIGVEANGEPVFEDINQDGVIDSDVYAALEPDSDYQLVGSGVPDLEVGWSHDFQLNGWQLRAFFRGAFGHRLVNRSRLFLEPRPIYVRKVFNIVETELAEEALRLSRYSSLYVEKADFLKLDNLSIARSFPLGGKSTLNVSLTGQNLFVLTNYTGPDPEPVFEDRGDTTNGSRQSDLEDSNPLAPGIDRRNHYLPARTFVLGLSVSL